MEKRSVPGQWIPDGTQYNIWHCDVCGAESDTTSWKAHDGEEGYWCYKCVERKVKSQVRTVKVDNVKWTPGYVDVKCCGSWLRCDAFTNTCDHCGADYNSSGSLLAPREQWGEETGETAADILRADD